MVGSNGYRWGLNGHPAPRLKGIGAGSPQKSGTNHYLILGRQQRHTLFQLQLLGLLIPLTPAGIDPILQLSVLSIEFAVHQIREHNMGSFSPDLFHQIKAEIILLYP